LALYKSFTYLLTYLHLSQGAGFHQACCLMFARRLLDVCSIV